jgi:hypothetical protein
MTQSYAIWLVIGVVLGIVLLTYARTRIKKEKIVLSIGLLVAAFIYVCFALVWGNFEWFLIELAGVPIYGLFYWLAVRYSYIWLAVGWAVHPIWDAFLHLKGPGHFVAPEWYILTRVNKWRTIPQ